MYLLKVFHLSLISLFFIFQGLIPLKKPLVLSLQGLNFRCLGALRDFLCYTWGLVFSCFRFLVELSNFGFLSQGLFSDLLQFAVDQFFVCLQPLHFCSELLFFLLQGFFICEKLFVL